MNQVFAEPTKLVLVYVTVVCLCEGHSEFQIRRLWKQRRKWLGDWWPLWEQLLCDLQSLTELLENGNDNESEDAGWRAICRRGQQGWLNGSWGCPRDGNRRSTADTEKAAVTVESQWSPEGTCNSWQGPGRAKDQWLNSFKRKQQSFLSWSRCECW